MKGVVLTAAAAAAAAGALSLGTAPLPANQPSGTGVNLPAPPPPGARASISASPGVSDAWSYNWSGYAQAGKRMHVFTAVKAYWRVPRLAARDGGRFASDWLGIDGANNGKVVQGGTESDTYDNRSHYSAWTEIYPAYSVTAPLTIRPGDAMEGIVREIARNRWRITLKDLSGHASFTRTVRFATFGQDAEAVHERPSVNGQLADLARTTDVTFRPGYYSAVRPGRPPRWNPLLKPAPGEKLMRIFMVDNQGSTTIASPSAPNRALDGFTVTDGKIPPPPPRR